MKKLIIDLATLPEEGKKIAGTIDASIFQLSERDPQPKGPLAFELQVQRFESEVLLQGKLSCPFEFECVRTLHPFLKTISLPAAAVAIEVGNFGEIDATEALREELLLEIPNHPTCEIADDPTKCEINPLYLAVDKPHPNEVYPAPREEKDDRWSALDSFQADQS